ncbi:hypothetical protein CR983_04185 [Candidatus Saccharibacteria bacterium]|nr:MAG: hypothetical protein CR983_04185 [Candidatus Saccharibacteria bacterium]
MVIDGHPEECVNRPLWLSLGETAKRLIAAADEDVYELNSSLVGEKVTADVMNTTRESMRVQKQLLAKSCLMYYLTKPETPRPASNH